ncbi:hypothetical protein AB7M71_000830 [Bradyrhizobium japonicum]
MNFVIHPLPSVDASDSVRYRKFSGFTEKVAN